MCPLYVSFKMDQVTKTTEKWVPFVDEQAECPLMQVPPDLKRWRRRTAKSSRDRLLKVPETIMITRPG